MIPIVVGLWGFDKRCTKGNVGQGIKTDREEY
jgi:hypothetical protein